MEKTIMLTIVRVWLENGNWWWLFRVYTLAARKFIVVYTIKHVIKTFKLVILFILFQ